MSSAVPADDEEGGGGGVRCRGGKHSLGLLLAFTCLSDADCSTAQHGPSRWRRCVCKASHRWINSAAYWPVQIKSRAAGPVYTRRLLRSISRPACDADSLQCIHWNTAVMLSTPLAKGNIITHLHRLCSSYLRNSFDQTQEFRLYSSMPSFGNDLTGQVARKYVDLSKWQVCNVIAHIRALFLFTPDCLFTQLGERGLRGIKVAVIPLALLGNGEMSAFPDWR